jgi:hypothetical protein
MKPKQVIKTIALLLGLANVLLASFTVVWGDAVMNGSSCRRLPSTAKIKKAVYEREGA